MTAGGKGAKSGIWAGMALGLALACAGLAPETSLAADAPAVAPAPPADTAVVPSPQTQTQTQTAIAIMQVDAALQGGDCAKALPLLAQLWDDANLQSQDAVLAEKYRFSRVICTAQQQDIKSALVLSTENLSHAGAGIDTYDLHAFLLLSDNRPEEAAGVLDEALTRFPGDAAKLTDESVVGTLMALQAKAPGAPAVLDHLEKAHWQPGNITLRLVIDDMRLEALRAAAGRHDRALADLYRADLTSNTMLYIVSQGDGKISDPGVAPWPIKTIIRKQINELGLYVTAHPNELFAVDYLVTLERMNEDDGPAQVQISTIIDLIEANGLAKFDSPESLPGLFIKQAMMLAENGKIDTAAATFKMASDRMSGPELFQFNLSHMKFLMDVGRDKDALAVDSRIDILSLQPGERRQLAAAEACLYGYMGDTVRYQAALGRTRGGSGIGEMQANLCAGDLDKAAQALIRAIGNPDQRDTIITLMQTTLPDIPYSPRSRAYQAGFAALKKRPDVLAAAKAQDIIIRAWPLRF